MSSNNPLKQARLNLGLTQKELAFHLAMTPGAVLKYEQGLYEQPSQKLVEYLAYDDEEADLLVLDYHSWRCRKRRSVNLPALGALSFSKDFHPMETYRNSLQKSPQGFCVMLCIHPGSYADYESGHLSNMPRSLSEALSDGGLSRVEITIIQDYAREFHIRYGGYHAVI